MAKLHLDGMILEEQEIAQYLDGPNSVDVEALLIAQRNRTLRHVSAWLGEVFEEMQSEDVAEVFTWFNEIIRRNRGNVWNQVEDSWP